MVSKSTEALVAIRKRKLDGTIVFILAGRQSARNCFTDTKTIFASLNEELKGGTPKSGEQSLRAPKTFTI